MMDEILQAALAAKADGKTFTGPWTPCGATGASFGGGWTIQAFMSRVEVEDGGLRQRFKFLRAAGMDGLVWGGGEIVEPIDWP